MNSPKLTLDERIVIWTLRGYVHKHFTTERYADNKQGKSTIRILSLHKKTEDKLVRGRVYYDPIDHSAISYKIYGGSATQRGTREAWAVTEEDFLETFN